MPAISTFYGIIIYMYFIDNKQHSTPHIHVKYQEHEAVVSIPDGIFSREAFQDNLKLLHA